MNKSDHDIAINTTSAEETVRVGAALGRCCAAGDIVALQGELGAGKTQLVRGLAEGLGLEPRHVSSPTFVLMQEYESADDRDDHPTLVHIDAYRIKSEEDLTSIGWLGRGEEMRENAVVAIEWAALIEPALGDDVLWINITHEPFGRCVVLSARGAWQAKISLLTKALQDAGLVVAKGNET